MSISDPSAPIVVQLMLDSGGNVVAHSSEKSSSTRSMTNIVSQS